MANLPSMMKSLLSSILARDCLGMTMSRPDMAAYSSRETTLSFSSSSPSSVTTSSLIVTVPSWLCETLSSARAFFSSINYSAIFKR